MIRNQRWLCVRACVRARVCARVHGRLNSVHECVRTCVRVRLCRAPAHVCTMQLNHALHMADRWRLYSTRPMQRPAPIYY